MPAESRLKRVRERYHEIAGIAPAMKGPRAYWNWAIANLSMLLRTSRLRARPLKLTFDPTNLCQLKCPLCPTGLRIQDRSASQADLHIFEHLMQELGEYVFFIDFFNWGEPLLNKNLGPMLQLAARNHIVSVISTNLSLPLSDERLHSLLTSGLSQIIVSIDGASQESYGTYRREGNFELAFENLRRLMAIKKQYGLTRPVVVWRFYVFRFNEHEIERAKQLAAEIGVDRIVFGTPFLDEGRFPLSPADREAMKQWASTLPEFNRYLPDHPEYEDPRAPVEKRTRCDWHYVSTAINPDGSVAPCCAVFEKANDFGSVAGGASYMDVVNNERFVAIRDRFAGRRAEPTGLVCEQCPTPVIMDYGKLLNRNILMLTLVQLAEAARRVFARGSRAQAAGDVATRST